MKKYILLSLLFFCNASIMMGQEKQLTISGHVFDESNESLPGVSVYLKDRAGVGTSTDINGAFKLSAQKGDMIIFSFIGYKKMEHIVLKDEKNLRIMLKSDSQQMDEVVITGMGTKEKKVNLTGAVTNVDISQIQTPATSLTNSSVVVYPVLSPYSPAVNRALTCLNSGFVVLVRLEQARVHLYLSTGSKVT